ncbi:hypothetical protein ACQ86N_08940 [Puia sp. P3]|uniref:hypothetical protein n=1 Tax=Puia sp. P3 TaxID=3423952 RepID=UPI003D6665B6
MIDWQPLWLSLRLATLTTAILLLLGIPLAWWLAERRRQWKALAEAVISLPMVLPPRCSASTCCWPSALRQDPADCSTTG